MADFLAYHILGKCTSAPFHDEERSFFFHLSSLATEFAPGSRSKTAWGVLIDLYVAGILSNGACQVKFGTDIDWVERGICHVRSVDTENGPDSVIAMLACCEDIVFSALEVMMMPDEIITTYLKEKLCEHDVQAVEKGEILEYLTLDDVLKASRGGLTGAEWLAKIVNVGTLPSEIQEQLGLPLQLKRIRSLKGGKPCLEEVVDYIENGPSDTILMLPNPAGPECLFFIGNIWVTLGSKFYSSRLTTETKRDNCASTDLSLIYKSRKPRTTPESTRQKQQREQEESRNNTIWTALRKRECAGCLRLVVNVDPCPNRDITVAVSDENVIIITLDRGSMAGDYFTDPDMSGLLQHFTGAK